MKFLEEIGEECWEFYYGDKYRYNKYTNDIIKEVEDKAKALFKPNQKWIRTYTDFKDLTKEQKEIINKLDEYNNTAFYERMKILAAKEKILLEEQKTKRKAPPVTEEDWFLHT